MTRRPRTGRRLAATARPALLLACLSALAAPGAHAGPYDIVPRGDIAYDQLGALAAAGRVPGATLRDFLRGDRLYTRREVAEFVLRARAAAEGGGAAPLTPQQQTQLRALQIAFEPELRTLAGYAGPYVPADRNARGAALTGQFKLRAASEPAAADLTARFSGTLPVGRDGFAALSVGNYRDEWYSDAGATKGGYPAIETAFVRVNTRALDFTVGRRPLRWGPGYADPLLLSDEAPSVPSVQIEKGFRLPGWLGQRLGRIYYTQFAGQFYEDDVPTAPQPYARGTRRYLSGRRIEFQEAGRFTFSVAETLKSTRLPDALYSVLMPSLYFYQDTYTRYPEDGRRALQFLAFSDPYPDTSWANYLGEAQLGYRVDSRGTLLYSDLLLDDVKAPAGIGNGFDTPRKIGLQLGAYAPALDRGGHYGLRVEYATIDAGTYLNASPPVYHTNNNLPLGHGAGANANVFFGRLDATVSPRVKAAAEAYVRRSKDETGGDPAKLGASSPVFDLDRYSLFATYSLRRDAFVGLRLDHTRLSVPGQPKDTNTRAELSLGCGF
jgi:hypothetical protein